MELGRSYSQQLSINDPQARIVADKPSGAIALSDFAGKDIDPVLTQNIPTSKNTLELSTLVLTANASNYVRCQWYRNGVAISGYTNPTFSKVVGTGEAGGYKCIFYGKGDIKKVETSTCNVTVTALPIVTGLRMVTTATYAFQGEWYGSRCLEGSTLKYPTRVEYNSGWINPDNSLGMDDRFAYSTKGDLRQTFPPMKAPAYYEVLYKGTSESGQATLYARVDGNWVVVGNLLGSVGKMWHRFTGHTLLKNILESKE